MKSVIVYIEFFLRDLGVKICDSLKMSNQNAKE